MTTHGISTLVNPTSWMSAVAALANRLIAYTCTTSFAAMLPSSLTVTMSALRQMMLLLGVRSELGHSR
jgi:hypothetical protein